MEWAENLHKVLSDPDGVELYKQYLKTENVSELLDFWFACEGLKRLPVDQTEKMFQLIKVINRKYLCSKVVPIVEETRKTIQDKIGAKQEVNQRIFDAAQVEVEERMAGTTYRNFLASEMYLNFIKALQTGESDLSAKASSSHSTESSISGPAGPRLQDDSRHFSALPDIEKSKLNQSLASTGTDSSMPRFGARDMETLQSQLAETSLAAVPRYGQKVAEKADSRKLQLALRGSLSSVNEGMMARLGLVSGAAGTSVGPPRAPRPLPGLTQMKPVIDELDSNDQLLSLSQAAQFAEPVKDELDSLGEQDTWNKDMLAREVLKLSVRVGSLFRLEPDWKYKVY